MLDANVFVAAVKNVPRRTATLELLVRILGSDVWLITDAVLVEEHRRCMDRLPSPTAAAILRELGARCVMVEPSRASVRRMMACMHDGQIADAVHAAACAEARAVLVSNDRGFHGVARAGLVEVWSTTRALSRLRIR